jgi:hypothetical protein
MDWVTRRLREKGWVEKGLDMGSVGTVGLGDSLTMYIIWILCCYTSSSHSDLVA